jgi:hypothetical protein
MESEHELHGLPFWNGDPTGRLLEAAIATAPFSIPLDVSGVLD